MDKFETSSDVLSSLTPHQLAVLLDRFGLANTVDDDLVVPPSSDGSDDGASGAPATLTPLQ